MKDDKSLLDKTTEAVANAAQTVTDGLKSAGEAMAEAITPKPIRAGDSLILPSTDPSMPPIVMPLKKRVRAKSGKAAAPARRTKAGSRTGSRKQATKGRAGAAKARTAAKTGTTSKAAKRQPRKAASRRTAKAARR
jgi:hypothetical protein